MKAGILTGSIVTRSSEETRINRKLMIEIGVKVCRFVPQLTPPGIHRLPAALTGNQIFA